MPMQIGTFHYLYSFEKVTNIRQHDKDVYELKNQLIPTALALIFFKECFHLQFSFSLSDS